jgi:iron(III) transport system permease protein
VILQALYPGYGIPGSIHQLTFKNFQDLLAIPLAVDAIKNSLVISTIGSFLLVFLAFFISYIVHRTEFKFRRFLDVISMLPVSIPSIVIALGIFLYFVYIMPVFLYISIWSIMLGLMIRFIGHSVRAVSAGLSQVHQILEEAARVHGVPRHIIVYDIYIKILVPTFISTYTFIFIYFVRELPLSILLATSKNMVWTAGIYTLLELGNLKLVMAFALLEILLILSVRYVGNYLTKFVARWYI